MPKGKKSEKEEMRGDPVESNRDIYNTFDHNIDLDEEIYDYLMQLYEKNGFQPNLSSYDLLRKLAILPDPLLIPLVIDISLLIRERSCFKYEEREPGCIAEIFNALTLSVQDIENKIISTEMIKSLHKVNTNTKKVKIESIDEETSGEFRSESEGAEYVVINFDSISVDGLEHLIELIDQEILPNSVIALQSEWGDMFEKMRCYNELQISEKFLKELNKIKTKDPVLFIKEFINELKNEKFFDKDITDDKASQLLFSYIQNNIIPTIEKMLRSDLLSELKSIKNLEDMVRFFIKINNYYKINLNLRNLILDLEEKSDVILNQAIQLQHRSVVKSSLFGTKEYYDVKNNRELAEELYERYKLKGPGVEILYIAPSAEDAIEKLNFYLKEYNEGLPDLEDKSDQERLEYIFKYIQLFLLIHPFVDANNRTFANQLANQMLLQQHFMLASYFNPSVFYIHSLPEIVETVKLAIANTCAMIDVVEKGENHYFDFHTADLTNDELLKISEFVVGFRHFLQQKYPDVKVGDINDHLEDQLRIRNRILVIFNKMMTREYKAMKKDPVQFFSNIEIPIVDFKQLIKKRFQKVLDQFDPLNTYLAIIEFRDEMKKQKGTDELVNDLEEVINKIQQENLFSEEQLKQIPTQMKA